MNGLLNSNMKKNTTGSYANRRTNRMSDERKPVICPWCGWEMVAREGQDIFHGKYNAYVCEGCEAVSPIAYSEDAAYAAATKRASNLPQENS